MLICTSHFLFGLYDFILIVAISNYCFILFDSVKVSRNLNNVELASICMLNSM